MKLKNEECNIVFELIVVAAERCTFFHHECTLTLCSDGPPYCVLGTCTCTMNTWEGIITI